MKAPLSWIKEYVDVPADVSTAELTERLTMTGLKLEAIHSPGAEITGPLVVGRVLTMEPEPQKNGKTINWCTVDVGEANGTGEPQGIVCGAHNFAPGDLVAVVLPGGVLPGGFAISARKTYGHVSAGMICSARELGLGEDHDGIIVLPADAGEPGQDVRPLLGLDEEIIELEVNPDRAYGLSLRGIARDVEVSVAGATGFRDPALRETPPADDAGWPVEVEDAEGCPVFVARTVSGFDPEAPTPDFIAQRLQAAGMRPISLAVDVTNYVMLETGRPIHGYDADKVQGTIRVRRARAGETLTTLDGTQRRLSEEDLVVTDDSGIIGLGGVMGGETTEMSASTTRILVESAHWDATSMFRTGKRHKISSEAGKRNERGVDPTICEAAADRVVELLTTYGGATADPGHTVVGTPPAAAPITMAVSLPARISGLDVDADQVVADLEAVGCAVERDGDQVVATPPPWRPDIRDPHDLVEEVVRLRGYDRIPSVLPKAPGGRGLTRAQALRRRVGRTLAGAGWVEVVDFPFVGDADLDALGIPADDPRRTLLRLSNPLSAEAPAMTTTLLPALLRTAARNVGHGNTSVAIFETASVTLPRATGPAPILPVDRRPTAAELAELLDALPDQPLHLGLVATGEAAPAGWWGAGRPVDWTDAVAGVRVVADALGLELTTRPAALAPWHPGRCAELLLGDVVVGHAGELHPRVCTTLGLPARSVAAEVDLDVLLQHAVHLRPAPAFSTYPVAKEDVALVVDADVPAGEVEAALREGAGELLESVRLFDVYTGDQVGEGRRSLAFALRFRAPDRTLTEDDIVGAREAAVARAAERTGATQRT
ncbi:phenylalanine--tRNA ligase subunit beta [Nocardioides sp. zg-579]|uniref:Phenylalanine--tRNA ligase beta subunit n=1 Tax=Nocardioides marmotae TaxID=2663857 RepID=A0A6I3JGP8_9ACTN|nr:phenylalanine--tRNA ligase subunit beta [Nocardioides marmotae]MCR6033683.1 phenylalanine--tRNA ligase subunit beta [Gordonia jinghuaiqii]MTB97341.1 phenylalanine--tRNA ligase subunit beta [Nocardioides marmotae]QKE01686.1 phenylalanine--tRNA ligase subunit beta [Nocardioides marmotae]